MVEYSAPHLPLVKIFPLWMDYLKNVYTYYLHSKFGASHLLYNQPAEQSPLFTDVNILLLNTFYLAVYGKTLLVLMSKCTYGFWVYNLWQILYSVWKAPFNFVPSVIISITIWEIAVIQPEVVKLKTVFD